jgi:hypothetical protein
LAGTFNLASITRRPQESGAASRMPPNKSKLPAGRNVRSGAQTPPSLRCVA